MEHCQAYTDKQSRGTVIFTGDHQNGNGGADRQDQMDKIAEQGVHFCFEIKVIGTPKDNREAEDTKDYRGQKRIACAVKKKHYGNVREKGDCGECHAGRAQDRADYFE